MGNSLVTDWVEGELEDGLAEASKGVSEALSRLSMVGEGIRAYRTGVVPATSDLSSQVETAIDPMYDPEVQELNIEEIMMQEAWTGHEEHKIPEQAAVDKQMEEAIVGARDIRDSVMQNAKEARSGIQRRMEEFEPLLDVSRMEEREITEDQLHALQEKLDELKGASFGQNMKMLSEIQEHSRPMEEVLQEVINEQTGHQVVLQEVATEQTAAKQELTQDVIPEETAVKEEMIEEVKFEQTAVKALKDEAKQEVIPEHAAVKEEEVISEQTAVKALKEEVKQEVIPEHAAVKEEVVEEVISEQTAVKAVKEEVKQEVIPEHAAVKEEVIEEVISEQTAVKALKEEVKQEVIPEHAAVKEEVIKEITPEQTAVKEEVIEEVISEQTAVKEELTQEVILDQAVVKEEVIEEVISEQTAVKALKEEVKQEVITEHAAVKEEVIEEVISEQTAVKALKEEVKQEVITEHAAVKEEVIEEVISEQTAVKALKEEVKQEVITEHAAVKEEVIKEITPEQTAVKEEVKQEVVPEQTSTMALKEVNQEVTPEQAAVKEEVIEEVISEQAAVKEEVVQVVVTEQTGLKEEVLAKPLPNTSDGKEEALNPSEEIASVKKEVEKELDSTLAQVAKTINLEEANTSTVHDFDVELQANPAISKDDAEKVVITASPESSSTDVDTLSTPEDFIVPNAVGSGPAAAASISGAAIASASIAAASTTAAAAATVAASTTAAAAAASTTATAAAASTTAAAAAASTTAAAAAATVAASPVATQSVPVEKPKPAAPKPKLLGRKPLAKDKPKSTLASNAQARKVPHSRIGRLMSFGGLAAGLGAGTLAELTRRSLGMNEGKGSGSLLDASPFLTEANAKRIVDTLCRVRGAALKLGQMLSIQDNALINPQLQKIFERVRQSADFMPAWQLENALVDQFGPDWRSLVTSFDERPFAAASIGQVHLATLPDGRSVAMKIQYPGVAEGIDSDINNLIGTLKIANILPEGLYVDSVIEVAKKELNWECDYVREAECTTRFRELVKPYPEYYVPEVISQLCTKQVFSSELIDGVPVDKCIEMDQETRNYICEKILRLCLLELFKFGFMQTDPNWSNFFYNAETEQLALLDFGACRSYEKSFVDKYIQIIHGAATCNREKIYEYSKELGFLTGHEAKVMIDAHIDAVMILGEAFQEDKLFHFGAQDTTYRIQHLVPVMLSHRMCAPPEESYSLHRKMSGVFLLCARLNGQVNCKPLFEEAFEGYKYGGTWEEFLAGKL
ncbi:uncharacterized protein Coq8 isoform X3 [Penaeus vannamei]|uniref:uncharacterized protein Coq8 isoform X3 n=1 Tax=Penaeus vannamei TaxID=6689 RepID=UPI00387F844E